MASIPLLAAQGVQLANFSGGAIASFAVSNHRVYFEDGRTLRSIARDGTDVQTHRGDTYFELLDANATHLIGWSRLEEATLELFELSSLALDPVASFEAAALDFARLTPRQLVISRYTFPRRRTIEAIDLRSFATRFSVELDRAAGDGPWIDGLLVDDALWLSPSPTQRQRLDVIDGTIVTYEAGLTDLALSSRFVAHLAEDGALETRPVMPHGRAVRFVPIGRDVTIRSAFALANDRFLVLDSLHRLSVVAVDPPALLAAEQLVAGRDVELSAIEVVSGCVVVDCDEDSALAHLDAAPMVVES